MARKVLIVTHGGRPEAVAAQSEAVAQVERAGLVAVLHDDQADAPPSLDGIEAVVVLGGDGTILRAAELTRGTEVPLLGINLGHVGFLAESERESLRSSVERLASRDYVVEARTALEVSVTRPGTDTPSTSWALNEAAVEKADRQRMVEVQLGVDGRALSAFGCDGLLLSTATGSTAHAFSAGGPVLWPDVAAILVVPLAAHALFARPLVVGPRSTVTVEITGVSGAPGVVTMDGRRQIELPEGSRIDVTVSSCPVYLARLSAAPFTDRLVSKFSLPVRGWRHEDGPGR